jgi:mycofactocin precursor
MTTPEPDQRTAVVGLHVDRKPVDQPVDRNGTQDELVESDLLVEDVSIDGMCGVY